MKINTTSKKALTRLQTDHFIKINKTRKEHLVVQDGKVYIASTNLYLELFFSLNTANDMKEASHPFVNLFKFMFSCISNPHGCFNSLM